MEECGQSLWMAIEEDRRDGVRWTDGAQNHLSDGFFFYFHNIYFFVEVVDLMETSDIVIVSSKQGLTTATGVRRPHDKISI